MLDVFNTSYYGNTILQWGMAFGSILLSVIVARALYWVSGGIVKQLTKKTKSQIDDLLIDKAEEPIVAAVILLGINFSLQLLSMPEAYTRFIDNGMRFVWAVLVAWLIARAYDAFHINYLIPWANKSSNDLDDQLLPLIRSGVKLGLISLGIVVGLNNAGYDVTTILAGLGIGGLAFALAAQDSIANIFGGVIILIQRPFKIGDIVEIDGKRMIVKQIGLRSSTMTDYYTGYLLTIPNSKFTNSIIANVSAHPGYWAMRTLSLSPLTHPDQVQQAVELIGNYLQNYPEIEYGTIWLDNFTDYAFQLQFFFNVKEFNKRIRVLTEVNLEILRLLQSHHIQLALPIKLGINPTADHQLLNNGYPALANGRHLPAVDN
jgi:MscS family membrane protein